jgi:glycosyltransferase involved in cell wall biosynthesis
LDEDRISVCHNAIDPAEFNCDKTPTFSDADWDENCIVVGFVGTMNRWQGIPVFKTVIPEVIRCNPRAHFLMVGDGEYRQELQDHLIQSGCDDRVEFTGRRPHSDIPGYIARMDITVLPDSNSYGSPMKIFEYMAMGKAIVAPGVVPVQEIMEDGVTGFVITPGDADAMVRRILQLAGNETLRKNLGSAAREYVLGSHTWEANAKVIIHLAEKLGVRAAAFNAGVNK